MIFALPAGVMVPISWYLVQDTRIQQGERKSFRLYCSQAWALITNKAIFVVAALASKNAWRATCWLAHVTEKRRRNRRLSPQQEASKPF